MSIRTLVLSALAFTTPLGAQLPIQVKYGELPKSGRIQSANEIDAYWFSGVAGEEVRLGRWFDPRFINCVVEVLNPDRTRLTLLSTARRWLDFKLTQTGVHRLLVSDQTQRNTGNYTVAIQRRKDPVGCRQLCYSAQPARDRLSVLGQTQCFGITTKAGAKIRLSKAWDRRFLNFVTEVFDPSGKSVLVIGSGTAVAEFVPPVSGRYHLFTYDSGLQNTHSYSLRLTCLATDCGCTASWRNHGAGHPGTGNNIPTLTVNQAPKLGQSFSLSIGNSSGRPNTPAVLLLGGHEANVATNFGGILHIDPITVSQPIVLPAAGLSVPFFVENQPALLCDLCVHAQVALVDAGASKGLAFSRGLELVFGR